MKFGKAALGLVLAAGLASTASAMPITGSVSFSDGFDTLSASANAVVSDLDIVDVQGVAITFGPNTGAFATLSAPALVPATNFPINPFAPGVRYTFGGFQFNVSGVSNIVRTGLSCTGTLCGDRLEFDFTGIVTDTSPMSPFTASTFIGRFSANGSCNGTVASCSNKSAAWASSITATGMAVPEPVSMSLVGLGLIAAGGMLRRRRAAA